MWLLQIPVTIAVEGRQLDGVLDVPRSTSWRGCALVLTHGAGGDLNFHHLDRLASHAAYTGILCLRFTCRPPNLKFRTRCYVAAVVSDYIAFLRAFFVYYLSLNDTVQLLMGNSCDCRDGRYLFWLFCHCEIPISALWHANCLCLARVRIT